MIRDDLSNKLIHLTKGSYGEASNIFLEILNSKKLLGSNADIRGKSTVICFSETPINKLGYILAQPNAHNFRYAPFGIMFEKAYLFKKGARPVIYQTEDEFKLLKAEQQFRHVKFDLDKNVDWTWEREWRIEADELDLEEEHVTMIVPDRIWEEKFKDEHHVRLSRANLVTHGFGAGMIGKFKWHFIVLEDLGMQIPKNA